MADTWYYLNGISYHPTDRTYNERNTGTGFGYRSSGDILKEIAIGQYLNSNNKESNYVDYSLMKRINNIVSLGAGMGVVTGYGDPQPYIMPALKLGNKNYEINLRYAPQTPKNPEVWMMNFGKRL